MLSVGRLIPIKCFHLAISGFAGLAATRPGARLVVIGDGPLKGELERLAVHLGVNGQVEFRQWMPRDEVLEAMRRADVFLFPSAEGGGMVVLEATGVRSARSLLGFRWSWQHGRE